MGVEMDVVVMMMEVVGSGGREDKVRISLTDLRQPPQGAKIKDENKIMRIIRHTQ